MRLTALFALAILIHVTTYAMTAQQAYYGELLDSSTDVKTTLHHILAAAHIQQINAVDKIVSSCEEQTQCQQHTAYGYNRARTFLFGKFYLIPLDASNYGIKEMYCDRIYQKEDFSHGDVPGDNIIPDSTILNVEHTWPQSKFTSRYPRELQKSDLHHLFPTDSVMNALRGNNIFGEVDSQEFPTKCGASRLGSGSAGTTLIFEPPDDHKGHVARALFYFSIRYELAISPEEEIILKKWHREHPVDQEEMRRNDEIQQVQFNRNPFIDHPELVDKISNF